MAMHNGFNIFGLLREGTIVGSNQELRLVVLWNESITFRVFSEDGGWFVEQDVFTAMETPSSEEARESAARYLEKELAASREEESKS